MLWGLSASLSSPERFDHLQQMLTTPCARFIFWGFLAAFIYHFVAGIRHLLMDIHVGEELKSGRLTAMLTLLITSILIILAGGMVMVKSVLGVNHQGLTEWLVQRVSALSCPFILLV